MPITSLGTTVDGRAFTYDASRYEFYLDGEATAFADVKMLESRNWVRWRATALRDWFAHIDAAALDACNRRVRAARFGQVRGALPHHARAAASAAVGNKTAQQVDTLVYRSDNESVASVDANGIVMVHGSGTASIFAHRERGGSKGAEVKLVGIMVPNMQRDMPTAASAAVSAVDAACLPLRSCVARSFKSKDGKLSKNKSFSLASSIDAPVLYKKTSGTSYVAVSEDGTVDVFKGLETGLHAIVVQATPVHQPSAMNVIETITVEINVK